MRRDLSVAPEKAAALFIDLQEEHRRDRRYLVAGFDAVIANARSLQGAARDAGIPVFHAAYIVDPAVRQPFHPMMADGTSATTPFSHLSTHVHPCPSMSPIGHRNTHK